jgi:uncharacterized protein YjbI with pentapeptide repeats
MVRARQVRRVVVGLVAAVLAFALTACDPTPQMVKGIVTLDGSGAPATGLVVTAYSDAVTPVATATVGTDGRFAFHESKLAAGQYRLRLGDSEWYADATTWADAQTVTASADEPAQITASVQPATITGTITTAGGDPVSGATVSIISATDHDLVAAATTGPDGSYTIEIAPGTRLVRASAPGQAITYHGGTVDPSLATEVEIGTGETKTVDIGLAAESTMSGFLTDGDPVVGAEVIAVSARARLAAGTTDSHGNFTIRGLPAGEYGLMVARNGVLTPLPHLYPAAPLGPLVMPGIPCPHPGELAGADLQTADLAGADLRGCDLTHADLRGADLTGANLTGADLRFADLTGANLTEVDAIGAHFGHAHLNDAVLHRANLQRAAVEGYSLNTDFSDANLGLAWMQMAEFNGARFDRANLRGATLLWSDARDASFLDADLTGANLDGTLVAGANFSGVRSGSIIGRPAGLPASWRLLDGMLIGHRANLPGVDLSNANLSNMNLAGTNLAGAHLANADLSSTNLAGADLSGAELSYANLTSTNLTDASLAGARISGAALHGTVISGADLSDTAFFKTRSGGITGTPSALPPRTAIVNGYLAGPSVDLRNAQLDGANMSDLDLTEVELDGAVLTGADLTGAHLQCSSMRSVDLAGATLTEAWIYEADLDQSILTGADLDRALLSGTVLTGADLTNADLDSADLSAADLPGATLVGANLSSANLVSADLRYADLSRASFAGAYAGEVDFSSADLTDAWMQGTVLWSSTFHDTIVTGVWFDRAVLEHPTSSGLVGSPRKLPPGWTIADGQFVTVGR